jgi:hypothetical protein
MYLTGYPADSRTMNALVLSLFAAVSPGRPGRIYEYPFFVDAVWDGWLLPRAGGLEGFGGVVLEEFLADFILQVFRWVEF